MPFHIWIINNTFSLLHLFWLLCCLSICLVVAGNTKAFLIIFSSILNFPTILLYTHQQFKRHSTCSKCVLHFICAYTKMSPGLAKLIIYVNRRENANSCHTNERGLIAYYAQRLYSKSSREKICKFAFASLFALVHTERKWGSGSSSCDCIIIWKPSNNTNIELNWDKSKHQGLNSYIYYQTTNEQIFVNQTAACRLFWTPILWVKCHLKIEWIKTIDSNGSEPMTETKLVFKSQMRI